MNYDCPNVSQDMQGQLGIRYMHPLRAAIVIKTFIPLNDSRPYMYQSRAYQMMHDIE